MPLLDYRYCYRRFECCFYSYPVKRVPIIELAEHYFSDLRVTLLSASRDQSERIAVELVDESSLDEVADRSSIDRGLNTGG